MDNWQTIFVLPNMEIRDLCDTHSKSIITINPKARSYFTLNDLCDIVFTWITLLLFLKQLEKNDTTGLLTHTIGDGGDDFCKLHFMRTALGGENKINSWRNAVRVAPQSKISDAKVIGPLVKLSKKKPDPRSA